MSQILPYVAILILLELTLQLRKKDYLNACGRVAILILLELTLQFKSFSIIFDAIKGRNPYFIGINSAIEL